MQQRDVAAFRSILLHVATQPAASLEPAPGLPGDRCNALDAMQFSHCRATACHMQFRCHRLRGGCSVAHRPCGCGVAHRQNPITLAPPVLDSKLFTSLPILPLTKPGLQAPRALRNGAASGAAAAHAAGHQLLSALQSRGCGARCGASILSSKAGTRFPCVPRRTKQTGRWP